jgi:hypothetical protein
MDRRDRLRLAGETGVDPRTVDRWCADATTASSATDYALRAACSQLGIPVPGSESHEEAVSATEAGEDTPEGVGGRAEPLEATTAQGWQPRERKVASMDLPRPKGGTREV